jgi:outer membrane protein
VNTIKQSAYTLDASEYAKKSAALELLSNVTVAYARLLLDKDQLTLVRSNIENTTKQLEIINEKIKVGRLTKYEGYTFNARLNSEHANLVSIQNDSSAAAQQLKQLLNIPYKQGVSIASIDTATLASISRATVSATEFIETILQKHPTIKEAEATEQAARLGEKIARSAYYPTLSIGGNVSSNYNIGQTANNGQKIPWNQQVNNNLGQNINVNLRIPIFSQMENAGRVQKEKINISNAKMARQQTENTIVTNTLQVVNDFNAAKQTYIATLASWQQNTLSHSLYDEKYRLGQISSVEMLASRDILNASSSRYLQARLQLYFQYQIIELLRNF